MGIKCTDISEKLGPPSSLLENKFLTSRSLGPGKNFGGTMGKWGKKKTGKKKKDKMELVLGTGQIKESLLTGAFDLQCKVCISRENLLDIPIFKQIEKLCFLVLSVSHNVVLCN